MRGALVGALALAALLALVVGLGRRLPDPSARIGEAHLVALHGGERPLQVSALVVDPPGPESFRYAFSGGQWRCVSALSAPAHAGEIGELVLGLANARGLERAFTAAELERAALDPLAAIRVTLLRSDGVELLSLDVGAHLPGPAGGRAYVRRVGELRALEIDAAPRPLVDRGVGSLPPLLDQRVLAGTPLDPRRGVRRVFLDQAAGGSLELVPDPSAPGEFAWTLLVDGAPSADPPLPFRVAGWLAFLVRVPYEGFAAPARAAELGLAEPTLLTLVPPDAPPIVLEVGAPTDRPLAPVLNRTSALLLLVRPEHRALFTPSAAMLTDPSLANPWESWLRP